MTFREVFLAFPVFFADALCFPVYVDPVWYNLVCAQWDTVLILMNPIQCGMKKCEYCGHTVVLILMNVSTKPLQSTRATARGGNFEDNHPHGNACEVSM
jgi:hypothetical protein